MKKVLEATVIALFLVILTAILSINGYRSYSIPNRNEHGFRRHFSAIAS